jgi:Na+-driven multidrug efflux pump
MGILKWLYLISTLIVAIPLVFIGVTNLLDGNTVVGVGFLLFAVLVYALFEYLWVRVERRIRGLFG